MEYTWIALWLNKIFSGMDYTLLNLFHKLAEVAGDFFTPFFSIISLVAEKGIGLIILSVILMFFKKTRKVGVVMLVAILIGAVITNIAVKNLVARPRPYVDVQSDFHQWWKLVGSSVMSEYSFPSGHTTATMAVAVAFFLCCNKKYSWLGFVFVVLMGMSRNYLMVHYPSDVIAGVLVGAISGVLSYIIVNVVINLSRTKNRLAVAPEQSTEEQ